MLALDGGVPQISYDLPTIKDNSGRSVGAEELALVAEVLASGNLGYLYGTKVKQFQKEWAARFSMRTAVAVSSGTAAIHTALVYLNIGPGDEVIVPAITDMGTIIAVLLQNAVPVFADVERHSQNIDPAAIEEKITKRTKAILPVHLYGFPCDMDPIMAIAHRHGIPVVEDCCQAHLAEYKGRLVGTIGDLGCFSFQQSKHMTTGDGGMVMTNTDELRGRKLELCADKGWPREQYRNHLFLAPNYHMTELQAAVGIAQLRKLDGFVDSRRRSANLLTSMLLDLDGVIPPQDTDWAKNTYYEYALGIEPDKFTGGNRTLAAALTAEGVKTAPSYLPTPIYMYDVIAKQETYGNTHCPFSCPQFPEMPAFSADMCPTAVAACRSMLFIPWNEKLQETHVADIAAAIRKVLQHFAR